MPGDVQFDEPTYEAHQRPARKSSLGLVEYLISTQLAKDEREAENYLLVIGAVMLLAAVAVFVLFVGSDVAPPEPLPPAVIPR